jgi:DNA-binding MarR family transcriptional regulator
MYISCQIEEIRMKHTEVGVAYTELVLEIFRTNGVMLAEGDRLTAELGLTSSRWQVMGTLENGGLPVPHIARKMGLTRQGVQKTVKILEKDGLIEFQENPHHKTAKLVLLSTKGRKRLALVNDIQMTWANDIAADQELDDLKTVIRVMRQIVSKIERNKP